MSSKIEQQVMAGVGAIYLARTLTNTTALKLYALILSVWMFGRLVWVSRVFQNFLMVEKNGVGSMFSYLLYAVEHTHLAVQVTLLVGLIAFVGLVVDTVRSLSAATQYAA